MLKLSTAAVKCNTSSAANIGISNGFFILLVSRGELMWNAPTHIDKEAPESYLR
ncbi:hypothetical protein S7335_4965 [Synechococcus sp. PCC 7335]|nr:hypothetical protein S7335_4965 [Synechococcus sp. PCC 7335]